MKSTTKRVGRALPAIIGTILVAAIGAMTYANINLNKNQASASNTLVEVIVYENGIPPKITSFAPNHGTALGGTLITFTGSRLNSITDITIGGAECTPIEVITPEEITCVTTAHVKGTVNIVLVSGAGSVTLEGAFTYDPVLPEIPDTGDEDGGSPSAPGTGMFLFGSSVYITFLDIILISFVLIALLGVGIYFFCCAPAKRKRKKSTAKKSSKKRNTTSKKSKK